MTRQRWLESLAVMGLVVVLAAASHVWITNRQGVLRAGYPLQAWVTQFSIRCSPDAPAWLHELTEYAIQHRGSLANQWAHQGPDGVLHHCESGWQGRWLLSARVAVDTRFRFASLSKLLTADAVLALANAGRLSLDDRLLNHWPQAADLPALQDARVGHITLRHLVQHRGGTDRLRIPDPMLMNNKKPWCPENTAALVSLRLDFEPGSRAVYANLGYCLLGVVIEQVVGMPFRDWMAQEYALSKRGLRYLDGPYLADEVQYDFRNSPVYGAGYWRMFDFPALSSSMGLSGSAAGLVPVLAAMPHRQPLNVLNAPPPDCRPSVHEDCYGYAVRHYRPEGSPLTLYIQNGTLIGATAQAVFDSQGGVTVWVGNGMVPGLRKADRAMADRLHRLLVPYYGL